jgi:hypothetical protein
MSLLGKKFPGAIGTYIAASNWGCGAVSGDVEANKNTAKPMLPFYVSGMSRHMSTSLSDD